MIALALAAALADAPVHDGPSEYLRDRHWDVHHLDLDLTVDVIDGTVAGTATHTVTPLGRRSAWMVLDAVGLDVSSVTIDGADATAFYVGAETLRIAMPPSEAQSHDVAITYSAHPETGVHFRSPSRGDAAIEAFTQGEDDDNRYWFPGWDYPNDKFTVTTQLTTRSNLLTLASGQLQEKAEVEAGWTRWSYALQQPVTNYLVTFATGEYTEVQVAPNNVVYAPKGVNAEDAARSLGKVVEMIPWVVEWTGGVDHPYPLYRQVVTQRFLYGAMENPTLVTFNTRYVLEEDSARPWRSEDVVMHELAHQWFGNLVTTYGWEHLWLNEGFATLLASDWMAQHYGPEYAAQDDYSNRRSAVRSGRPMAALPQTRVGTGSHSDQYVQGSTVLRWIRHYIGRPAFDQGVHEYLMRNSSDYASSEDLRRSFEASSGRDLTWMFDQFVHGEGHPELSASWEHSEETLTVSLTVDAAWDFPVDIAIGTADGTLTRTVWVDKDGAELTVQLPSPPTWVIVDPKAVVPAKITVEQPDEAWAAALAQEDAYVRRAALSHISDASSAVVVTPLIAVADSPIHPQTRERAVRLLGEIGGQDSVQALLRYTGDDEAIVREASVDALGMVETSAKVQRALQDATRNDPDARTAASAMVALLSHDSDRALSLARTGLRSREDWHITLGAGIVEDLGDRRDVRRLLALLDPSESSWVRRAAMRAAMAIAKREQDDALTDQVRQAMAEMLNDRDVMFRRSVIRALGRMEDSGPALRAYAAQSNAPWLAEAARSAALASAKLGEPSASDDAPEGDEEDALQTLQERLDALMERMDRIERWR